MSNGQSDQGRPRWGTYSTRGHLDKRALTVDLLLFDKLIFPTPRADAVEDWERRGWQPGLQAELLETLGDELAYRATWEGDLQDRFKRDHARAQRDLGAAEPSTTGAVENLKEIASEIAFPATAMLLADAANADPMFVANQEVPPIAVAAFQSEAEANAAYALRRLRHERLPTRGADDLDLAALFTRTLAVPDLDDLHIEDAFDRVVELAKTAEYQRARRALYDWERSVVAGRWDVQGARAKLVELTLEHDALVRQYFRDRWVQRGVCVAAVIVPPSVGLVGGAVGFLGGLAASGLAAYATARAPKLTDPYSRPGAALSMAMDAVWKL